MFSLTACDCSFYLKISLLYFFSFFFNHVLFWPPVSGTQIVVFYIFKLHFPVSVPGISETLHFKYLWMNEQFIYWYFCIIHPVTNSIQTPTGDCLPVNEAQWMERAGGRLLLSPGFSSSLLLPSSRPGNSLWPYHPFIQICYLFS